MKAKFKQIVNSLTNADTANEIITKAAEAINSKLDQLIIERLKEAGHEFETTEQLHEFVKSDRCMIISKQQGDGSHNCYLNVDGITIATWNDAVEMRKKLTITMNNSV